MPKANLTTARISAFAPPPGKKEDVLFDTAIPGLGVRAQASGKKSYLLMYRFNGKQRKLSLGDVRVIGLSAARDRARQILGQVASGIDPVETRREEDRADARRLDLALEAFAANQTKRGVVTLRPLTLMLAPRYRSGRVLKRRGIHGWIERGYPFLISGRFGLLRPTKRSFRIACWDVSK